MKPQNIFRSAIAALTIVAFVWFVNLATAADNGGVDPTGTWKLVRINADTKAKSPEHTLKLKLEGGKFTGTIDGRSEINGKVKLFEWPIKDTKLQGGEFSFTVTHPPVAGNGPDSTATYEGKITGDTMKGTVEVEFNGNTFKRGFEGKRIKDSVPK